MGRKLLYVLLFGMLAGGCHGYGSGSHNDAGYAHAYKADDLTFFWNVSRDGDTFFISGHVKNTFFSPVDGLELTAEFLDDQNRSLGKGTYFLIPPHIDLDDTSSFTLRIRPKEQTAPATIRFSYHYRIVDSGPEVPPVYRFFEERFR